MTENEYINRRGRPVEVGATETLTMRVTPATKAALKALADAGGRSLSRQAELILSDALREPEGLADRAFGAPQVKALAVALARLAIEVEGQTGKTWREDRFTFETLILAFDHVIRSLAPAGHSKVPEQVREIAQRSAAPAAWQKPKGLAHAIAARFLIRLQTKPAISGEERQFRERARGVAIPDDDVILPRLRTDLGMAQQPPAARHAPPPAQETDEDMQRRREQLADARARAKAWRQKHSDKE